MSCLQINDNCRQHFNNIRRLTSGKNENTVYLDVVTLLSAKGG